MKRLSAWCLLLALTALLPGMGELAENVAHIAVQGHLAHADSDGDSHEAPGPEHGCAGPFHSCACCQTLLATVEAKHPGLGFSEPPALLSSPRSQPPASLLGAPIEHPPRA